MTDSRATVGAMRKAEISGRGRVSSFYNDEGTENGGLIFGGRRDADGKIVDSGVSLSFDKYGVNGQMLQLCGYQRQGQSIRRAASQGHCDRRPQQGRRRIVMEVKADGSSNLTFLDANGKVLNQRLPSGVPR